MDQNGKHVEDPLRGEKKPFDGKAKNTLEGAAAAFPPQKL